MATCEEDRNAAYAGPRRTAALNALVNIPEFKRKFVSMCNRLKINPYYLIQAIAIETNHTFSPKICNEIGASGLIQIVPSSARGLIPGKNGTAATDYIRTLSAIDQLPVIERFLSSKSLRFRENARNIGEFYPLILYPGGLTNPDPSIQKVPGTIVLMADDNEQTRAMGVPTKRKYSDNIASYRQNRGLDKNKDGFITVKDLNDTYAEVTSYIPRNIFDGVDGFLNTDRGPINAGTLGGTLSNTSDGTVTPYIASYKSFHPKIQAELLRRKFSTEQVETQMPFVKLTALMYVKSDDIAGDVPVGGQNVAWCPSLGLHGTTSNAFESIYQPFINPTFTDTSGNEVVANKNFFGDNIEKAKLFRNASIVGQTTTALSTTGTNRSTNLVSKATGSVEFQDPSNIPPPGITSITVERSTAGPMGVRGGLMKANIKIVAYSVGQFDTLIRYFLRPGTPLVLEYGRQSSTGQNLKTYDWNKGSSNIQNDFWKVITYRTTDIITRQRIIQSVVPNSLYLLKEYVHDNGGNYDIIMGYAVKFTTKMNKDNVYEIELVVHSMTQVEIPTVGSGAVSNCSNASSKCQVNEIREYFNPISSWKGNSYSKLLSEYVSPTYDTVRTSKYQNDIVAIRSDKSAGSKETTYFYTWKFFVEVVLSDENRGILSMFPATSVPFLLGSMLNLGATSASIAHNNDYLISNEVGYHPNLRSIDPNTMIIVNKTVQSNPSGSLDEYSILKDLWGSINDPQSKEAGNIPEPSLTTTLANSSNFAPDGDAANLPGVSSLTKGIWINSNAVKHAFEQTDSLTQAIEKLLTDMSNATLGYWHLQLLSNEESSWQGLHVVDMGISKRRNDKRFSEVKRDEILTSITAPVTSKEDALAIELTEGQDVDGVASPKYIYVFNEKNKRLIGDADTVGSELIDLSIDFGIPTAIATQVIAGVGGTAQKPTLNLIDIRELNQLKLMPGADYLSAICKTSKQTDAGDAPCRANPQSSLSDILKRIQEEKDAKIAEYTKTNKITIQGGFLAPFLVASAAAPLVVSTGLPDPNSAEYKEAIRKIEEAATTARIEAGKTALQNPNSDVVFGQLRTIISNYGILGTALQFVELNPSNMMRKLNLDSLSDVEDNNKAIPTAHAFNSSNLTKLIADLTLPGISGIQLFQSFLIDRTPSIIDTGFYIVTKVTHEITPDRGWITKIQGRFRYQPKDTRRAALQ